MGLPPDPRFGPAVEDRKPVIKAEKPRRVVNAYAEAEKRYWDAREEAYRQAQRAKNECSCDYRAGLTKYKDRYGMRGNLPLHRTWTDPKCVIHGGANAAP